MSTLKQLIANGFKTASLVGCITVVGLGLVGVFVKLPPTHAQQAPTEQLLALQPTITEEIKDQVAQSGKKTVNGGNLAPKVATQQSNISNVTTGLNAFKPSYCYLYIDNNPSFVVVVFAEGNYVYSTNATHFASLASACPSAKLVYANVVAVSGPNFTWNIFYTIVN